MKPFFCTAIILLTSVQCANTVQTTVEWAKAPVNLTAERDGTDLVLKFNADNQEIVFNGYAIFTGATESELNQTPSNTIPNEFCERSSGTLSFNVTITIRIGSAAQEGEFCGLSSTSVASGQYVAVRARLERDELPWSAAAIVQAP